MEFQMSIDADGLYYLGNDDLRHLRKTAFLCSRKVPASIVLKCYDWAITQRESGNCVISGFHSKLEKDVLQYLLKGSQPIILALARGLKTQLENEFKEPMSQRRLLLISPFSHNVKRITEHTSEIRNKMMLELADEVVVGFVSKGGQLEKILKSYPKKVTYL